MIIEFYALSFYNTILIKKEKRLFMSKSQAAIDFIMTYGWAIMMVLVAIGALAYFGVLDLDKIVGEKCVLPPGITCLDHLASANPNDMAFALTLKNNLGYDIKDVSVIVSTCTGVSSQAILRNGQINTFTPSGCPLISTQRFYSTFNVTFTNIESGVQHTLQGTIITKVTDIE